MRQPLPARPGPASAWAAWSAPPAWGPRPRLLPSAAGRWESLPEPLSWSAARLRHPCRRPRASVALRRSTQAPAAQVAKTRLSGFGGRFGVVDFSAAALVLSTAIGGGFLAVPHTTGPAGFWPSACVVVSSTLFLLSGSFIAADLILEKAATRSGSHGGNISYVSLARENMGPVGGAVVSSLFLLSVSATLVSQIAKSGQILSAVSPLTHAAASLLVAGAFLGAVLGTPEKTVSTFNAVLTLGFAACFAMMFAVGAARGDRYAVQLALGYGGIAKTCARPKGVT